MVDIVIYIGILTLPMGGFHENYFQSNYEEICIDEEYLQHIIRNTTYIQTKYIDWLEEFGIIVVPINIYWTNEIIDYYLDRVQGLLITGGPKDFKSVDPVTKKLVNSYYLNKLIHLYQKAIDINRQRFFLIWATCLGHQGLFNVINQKMNQEMMFNHDPTYQEIGEIVSSSKWVKHLKKITHFNFLEIFYFSHKNAISMDTWRNDIELKQNIKPVIIKQFQGKDYIMFAEFRHFPFYLAQFHIEEHKDLDNLKLNRIRKKIRKETVNFIKKQIFKHLDIFNYKTLEDQEIIHYFHQRVYQKKNLTSSFNYYYQ